MSHKITLPNLEHELKIIHSIPVIYFQTGFERLVIQYRNIDIVITIDSDNLIFVTGSKFPDIARIARKIDSQMITLRPSDTEQSIINAVKTMLMRFYVKIDSHY